VRKLIYCLVGFEVLTMVVMKICTFCYLLHACFLLGLFFGPEDGGDIFFRNVNGLLMDYTALYSRI
jgi:hypothetical protein